MPICAGAGIPMTWTLPFDPDSDILKQQEARNERQNDAAAGATEVMRIMFFAEFFHGGQTPGWLALTNSKFGCARIVHARVSSSHFQSLHYRSRVRNGEARAARGLR
jgi:hypothetical protein